MANNYTLGRGKIYFGKFGDDGVTPVGERYLGNTPECSFTIEAETLDHFSSDDGIKEKDDSVPLSTTRTGSFSTDNISPENLAYFFFGTDDVLSVTGATVTDEVLTVEQGYTYQLGTSPTVPQGQTNLTQHTGPSTNVIVTNTAGSTTYDEVDDYTIDLNSGQLTIVEGGAIASSAAQDIKVDYKTTTQSIARVVSGSTPIEGTMRFVSNNPKGKLYDYFMPWVKITPNGDFALKGDEWQVIPFNLEILKKTGYEAFYITERAAP